MSAKNSFLVALDCAAWLILEKQDWVKIDVFKRGL